MQIALVIDVPLVSLAGRSDQRLSESLIARQILPFSHSSSSMKEPLHFVRVTTARTDDQPDRLCGDRSPAKLLTKLVAGDDAAELVRRIQRHALDDAFAMMRNDRAGRSLLKRRAKT